MSATSCWLCVFGCSEENEYLCTVREGKRIFVFVFVVLAGLVWSAPMSAQALLTESTSKQQNMELRARAVFTKRLPYGWSVALRQDVRARMVQQTLSETGAAQSVAPYIRRMYTDIEVGYRPIDYVSLKAGYVFRVLGDKGYQHPEDYIHHRVVVAVAGHYDYRNWDFSLSEQLDVDCRMDEVDRLVQNQTDLLLRHTVQVGYSFAGSPLSLKSKAEVHTTLNQPTEYLNSCLPDRSFHQYLTSARAELGLKWKINDMHALVLTYRYQWDYQRGVTLTSLKHSYSSTHIIQLAYELGW